MLESLITNKTRIKLLLKFFLNSKNSGYLRNLESEFGESTNAIRIELNRFEKAGLLLTSMKGNKKMFHANTNHPLFSDINNILMKFIGIDQIIDHVISQVGKLEAAYITGDFAEGKDSRIIDLALVGEQIDRTFIDSLIAKAESMIKRRIKYIVLSADEMKRFFEKQQVLIIWKSDK